VTDLPASDLADGIKTGETVEVRIRRTDIKEGRLPVRAPDGEDVIIDLPKGSVVHDGDVYGPSRTGICYRIRIEPEKVLRITLNRRDIHGIEDAMRLGYALGDNHLEVLVEKESAYVPLALGAEKIAGIIMKIGIPVAIDIVDRIIPMDAPGYYPAGMNPLD
jgi:urease accessory protein UreE